jgi:hypothetical protein
MGPGGPFLGRPLRAPQAQRGAAVRRAAPQARCRVSQRPFSSTSFWHYFHFPGQTPQSAHRRAAVATHETPARSHERATRAQHTARHGQFTMNSSESISDKQRASARPAPPWWHASRSSGTASIIIYIADRVRTLGAVRERIAFTANSCAREARWRVKRANIEIGVLAGFAHRHTFVACSLRIATLQSYTNHDAIVF